MIGQVAGFVRAVGYSPRVRRRPFASILGLSVLLLMAVGVRLTVRGFDHADLGVLLELRGAQIWAGILVGAALAVAGVILQSMLRNPLASPDLLGLSTGSGLAVMLVAWLSHASGMGVPSFAGTRVAALAGSLGALALVYVLSQRRGLLDPISLVLVGVVVSLMCGAGIEFIRHFLQAQDLLATRLLMGGLRGESSSTELWVCGVVVLGGIAGTFWLGRAMDAMALGEDESKSVGVRVGGVRVALFVIAGALTAVSVVLAGAIGFVGLIGPHVVRMIAGPSHRVLVVGSALAGAAILVLSDACVSGFATDAGRVPLSVLTSLIGGPMLVILLRKMRGR